MGEGREKKRTNLTFYLVYRNVRKNSPIINPFNWTGLNF